MQGVFCGMSSNDYHAAGGVSSSMLRNMDPPARLPAYLAAPREVTPEMMLGTLAHHMLLEPDKPLPKIAVQPETYPAPPDCSAVKTKKASPGDPLPWHNGATYCKRWHAEAREAGLLVLTSDAMESLRGMVSSVSNHPWARQILVNCDTEVSIFLDYEWNSKSVLRKARLDVVPSISVLLDIKTVEDASKDAFAWKLADGYALQAAYYLDMWNEAIPHNQRDTFCFVVVERKPPYLVACYFMDSDDLNAGRTAYKRNLQTYMECSETKVWPGFSSKCEPITMPNSARLKLLGSEKPNPDFLW